MNNVSEPTYLAYRLAESEFDAVEKGDYRAHYSGPGIIVFQNQGREWSEVASYNRELVEEADSPSEADEARVT